MPAPLPVPGQVLAKFKSLLEQVDSIEALSTAAEAAGFEIKKEPYLAVISWHGYILAFELVEFEEVNPELVYKHVTFYSV